MATRMKQRRATAAQWAADNPILGEGEIGYATDTREIKVGDGTSDWNTLQSGYISKRGGGVIQASGASVVPLTLRSVQAPATQLGNHLEVRDENDVVLGRISPEGYFYQGSSKLPTSAEAVLHTIVDAAGDLLVGTGPDVVARLPKGTPGQQFKVLSDGTLGWESPPATDLSSRVAKAGDTMTGALLLDLAENVNALSIRNLSDNKTLHVRPRDGGGVNFVNDAQNLYIASLSDAGHFNALQVQENGSRVYSANNPPPNGGGSVITQTIRGMVTLGTGSPSVVDVTIPTVNMSKSQVRLLGAYVYTGAVPSPAAMLRLTGTTTLKVSVYAPNDTGNVAGGACYVSYEITEWS